MRVNQFEDAAGVGKIAGKGQENDPRYKTSLTVDVHPDTVAKEIAAFFPTKPPKTGQHHIKETDMKKINEVNPHDYDSDVDYYAALKRKPRAASDDYDPPEPAPSAEDDFYDKQARDRERHKQQVQTTYSDHEGVAPNNEKYNGIYTIKAVNKAAGENELYKWKNFHHGAKKVVDIKQVESKMPGGTVELTVYYVDNHKYGMWTPWKAEESRDPDHRFSNEVDGVDARVKQMAIHRARDTGNGVEEEFELAGVDVAYELGRRAYKQGMTVRDNPYSATREARKYDEWEKGLERGKWDAIEARRLRHSVGEQGVAEGTDVERKIHRTQALIQDYYNRSRNTSNDIKRDHYIDMARQLEYELEGMINDANQAEQGVAEGSLSEKINPKTLTRGFVQEKDMGLYTLQAVGDFASRMADEPPTMEIYAMLKPDAGQRYGKQIGQLSLKIAQGKFLKDNPGAEALVAGGVDVDPKYQRKGVASAMYAFAKEIGNDVIASVDQSDDAVAMWKGMRAKGVAEGSGQPTMRRVTHEKPSGNGEMVKVVTYEVLNSKGVTVKTGMSRETAASLLKHLKQQGK